MTQQHRMSKTSIYYAWSNMLRRCENPNHPAYRRYGGRGIFVCEEWHDFRKFFADMGKCPEGLTLERKNNDGPYALWNCKWATKKEQSNNMGYSGPVLDKSNKDKFFLALNLDSGNWGISNNYNEFAEQNELNPRTVIECLYSSRVGASQVYKGWEFGFMD